jgi:hypothetical protein
MLINSSMLSYIKKLLLTILLFSFSIKEAMAASLKDAFINAKKVAEVGTYATNGESDNILLNNTLSNLITTILSLLGVIFVALSVYGGFLYLTARGNDEQTKKALSIITRAVIGLVIILSAYAISYFIFKFFV